jgi:hypothetical protein
LDANPKPPKPLTVNADYEKELQTLLINAKDGDVIEIPEGTFSFTRSLSLTDVPNVTIKGAGKDKDYFVF